MKSLYTSRQAAPFILMKAQVKPSPVSIRKNTRPAVLVFHWYDNSTAAPHAPASLSYSYSMAFPAQLIATSPVPDTPITFPYWYDDPSDPGDTIHGSRVIV
uniref:Uncharacterized protein n=1 Tax=Odontella aurita TaxID=265563 RepID=A0A6U6D5U6_9STRA